MSRYSKERTERLVKMLETMWKVRRVGVMGSDVLIEWNNTVYFVCDNGGEWNVDAVNSKNIMRSVPYTRFGFELDVYNQAMRIMAHLRGEEVDYRLDGESDEDVAFMCELAKIPVKAPFPAYGTPEFNGFAVTA